MHTSYIQIYPSDKVYNLLPLSIVVGRTPNRGRGPLFFLGSILINLEKPHRDDEVPFVTAGVGCS